MANALQSATVNIDIQFSQQADRADTTTAPVGGAFKQYDTTFDVSGTGAGQTNRGHFEPRLAASAEIPAGGTFTLNLASFTDMFGDAAAWTRLKAAVLKHKSDSACTTYIEVTGLAANAIDGYRTKKIKKNAADGWCDPDDGLVVSAGAGSITISNNDGSNTAKFELSLLGY